MAGESDLDTRIKALEEEFEQGTRAKEALMRQMGITSADALGFEEKLSPKDKERFEDQKKKMAEVFEKATIKPAVKSRRVRNRGIRI